jgi:hypothetical protein
VWRALRPAWCPEQKGWQRNGKMTVELLCGFLCSLPGSQHPCTWSTVHAYSPRPGKSCRGSYRSYRCCSRGFPSPFLPGSCKHTHSLFLVALHGLLHMVELSSQPPAVRLHTFSLPPQCLDVASKQGLQVALTALAVLVELPLGLQQLVLLLQESHLPFRARRETFRKCVCVCVCMCVCAHGICVYVCVCVRVHKGCMCVYGVVCAYDMCMGHVWCVCIVVCVYFWVCVVCMVCMWYVCILVYVLCVLYVVVVVVGCVCVWYGMCTRGVCVHVVCVMYMCVVWFVHMMCVWGMCGVYI